MLLEVYTDGSATTNDKPGGWAYVIVANGTKYSEGSGHMERASNNDAELEAAIQGLRAAKELSQEPVKEEDANIPIEVTLVSDSQLILGWANGSYKFRQADKMDKYKTLQLYVANMGVKTRWVEGHSGEEHNERCDELANKARLGLERLEDIKDGKSAIGNKKIGVVCFWYKDILKVVDLGYNVIEDYDRNIHGPRGTILEVREDKFR